MYHVLKMSNKWYASDVSGMFQDDLIERLETFANEGTLSVVVGDLDDLIDINVETDEVTIVELD